MREPCDVGIAEARALMEAGRLSPVELVRSCLERIRALDGELQAWTLVDDAGALAAARRLERSGSAPGPLHGVPVGIKDIFYTRDMRTEGGSAVLAGFVPPYSATAVRLLERAGAVVLGKLRTSELATLGPAPTRNPWNLDHTAGGSSSGAGAAVAAGMCLASLGSQTGGSTGRPAAYTGVVGLKPEHGRVSSFGMLAVSPLLDHVGIFARDVADAATVLRAIAGPDPRDPYSIGAPERPAAGDPAAPERTGPGDPAPPGPLDSRDGAPERPAAGDPAAPERPLLAVCASGFVEHADREMAARFTAVAELLAAAGAQVESVDLGAVWSDARDALRTIVGMDCAAVHAERYLLRRQDYGPHVSAIIEMGLACPPSAFTEAVEVRRACRERAALALAPYDAVLCPGAPGPAPRGLESTGDPVMSTPWSLLGFPTITVPMGFGAGGLPLGLQLGSLPGSDREARLLATAAWCEHALSESQLDANV